MTQPFARRLNRFLVTGGSSALLNLLVLHGLVSLGGLSEGLQLDLANLLALEVGILYSFILCRRWVWPATPGAPRFWHELLAFHGAVALAAAVRLLLFSALRLAGVHYLLNAFVGIGVAAGISYLLYDRYVFTRR